MKRIVFSLATFGLVMSSAAYAQDTWRGMMVIKSATAGCQDIGAGSEFTVRYAPVTVGNGDTSKLALFSQFQGSDWAQTFELKGREFDGTLRPVALTSIWTGAKYVSPTSTNPPAVKVAFSSIKRTPNARETTAATEFLQVTGSISNFYPLFYNGCTVSFRMALSRTEPL